MRIRKPFAGGFIAIVILAAGAGLGSSQFTVPSYKQSDKVLHFITFFSLTLCFYWILETNRRRVMQFTFMICTLGLGIGSEFAQWFLPNDRDFDQWDIFANILGSGGALLLSSWYHKRMLERKRAAKNYQIVPGEDADRDVELGEGIGAQESGVTGAATVEEELDNWDENEEDWETTEPAERDGKNSSTPSAPVDDVGGAAKRND